MRTEKTRNLILCALFTALTAVGAFLRIPIPVVPFTLQLLFTMLSGLLLGGKLGAVSVCLYIAMGLLGLPVFAEGGGVSYVLKPSFGYIIGFAAASYVTGVIANHVPNPGYKRLLIANFAGLGIVYFFGMTYYYLMSNFLSWCADWLMAAVSVLLYFGCAGRYCPVHSWSGTRKKADSHHEKEQEVI